LVWVLARGHDYRRNEIAAVIEKLLDTPEILLEDEKAVRAALRAFLAHNVDFADILICKTNQLRGCDTTATFDRKAGRLDGFSAVT